MYGVASGCALPAVLWGRARYRAACMMLVSGGLVLQLLALELGGHGLTGYTPSGSHGVQAGLGLLVAAAFLWTAWRYRTVSFGLFALPMAFLLILPSALGPDRYTFSSPLVRGGWVAVHVATLLVADVALVF